MIGVYVYTDFSDKVLFIVYIFISTYFKPNPDVQTTSRATPEGEDLGQICDSCRSELVVVIVGT